MMDEALFNAPIDPVATRVCRVCGEEKTLLDNYHFRKTGRKAGKPYNECKPCRNRLQYDWMNRNREKVNEVMRHRHRRAKYGVTRELMNQMLAAQGGVCALCDQKNGKRELCIDHNHETGEVRGLLCAGCNFQVGRLENPPDPEWVGRARAYLADPPAQKARSRPPGQEAAPSL